MRHSSLSLWSAGCRLGPQVKGAAKDRRPGSCQLACRWSPPGLSGGAWHILPLLSYYGCGRLSSVGWAWGELTSTACHPPSLVCPTKPAGRERRSPGGLPEMRPASFIPHGMGRVSWNELEWNEFSQPKPLSFPPSIQQRLQLGAPPSAGSCSSGQSCPAPGGFHPVPTLGLTFVIRFWFSHLCYWAVLL